ncbi:hypothetical protein [Geminicoccus roseus]|uniref:hypothetical protein n=1 Tax=Geminicoccus roseus TaxID=404900 RepID=UPI0004262DF1|nr:hypothetical protein [Geminicoccus roseus]
MTIHSVRELVWLGLLACGLLLLPAPAGAQDVDVCLTASNGTGDPIPNCEVQVQKPVPYGRAETQGWAYYCTGDHPYYWGYPYAGYIGSYAWKESGFTGTANWFAQAPNKFDGTFTNWYGAQDLTVSLACSSTPQPDVQNCQIVGDPVGDPGCPEANIHNFCITSGGVSVCFQTFTQTCSNGVSYDCNAQFGIVSCSRCATGSKPTLSKRATAEKAAALARK